MKKSTWPFLLLFLFIISCSSKGKYNGTIILSWDNSTSRQEDKLVIENRLTKIGIKNYTIDVIDGKTIKIEVKNVRDTSRFLQLIDRNEELGFWETYDNTEVFPKLDDLDRRLGSGTDNMIFEPDSSLNWEQRDSAQRANGILQHPLWSRLQFAVQTDEQGRQYLRPGPEVGYARLSDTAAINSVLKTGYKTCFPADLILWWTLVQKDDSVCTLIALKKNTGNRGAFMNQSLIKDSKIENGPSGGKILTIKFDKEGTKLWEKMTRKNIGKAIAITLDNKVVSHPIVEGAITGGVASISGPDSEAFEIIQMGCKMIPFKTKPVMIAHHFEKKSN